MSVAKVSVDVVDGAPSVEERRNFGKIEVMIW